MKLGSLFSGIGGFDEGFHRAGFDVAWQVEIDESCRSVLRKCYPDTEILNDVKSVKGSSLASADVICAGFPCQDLSVAGKRAGLAGERSSLFHEIVRVVKEMRENTNGNSPTFLVLENVPGLFSSHGGRDFAVVLRELAESGAMDIAWTVLDAQWFGVAQRRRRVFIVADFRGQRAGEILSIPTRRGWDSPPSREARARVAAFVDGSPYADREAEHSRLVAGTLKQRGRGATDEVMDNLQIAATLNPEAHPGGHNGQDDTRDGHLLVMPILEAGARQGLRNSDRDLNSGGNSGGFRTEPGEHLVAAPITSASAKSASDDNDGLNGHLVTHALRSEGADASEDGTGRGTPLVTVFESRLARNGRGSPSEIVPPLKAESGQTGKGDSAPLAAGGFGVRRLTPTECERLMGLPDGWTAFGDDGKEISDSARYRMLGNSIVVNVSEWIARRIALQLQ